MAHYKKTRWHSFKVRSICEGCKRCVRGEKLVLFVTGLCSRKCFFCPISSEKYSRDVVFANEWKVKDVNNPVEIFEEACMTGAKGAGITGGDPFLKLDRTCTYISELKERFGSDFHIHLYTSLDLVNKESLLKLFNAGLDEIRFHPSLDDDSLWDRILIARDFSWSVGVEIPVIPGMREETEKLLRFLKGKIDFLNLNELEFSDTDSSHYVMDKYSRKNNESYGVLGSEELALDLLDVCYDLGINAHYCTARLKNRVQVGERLKRRALHVALATDEFTDEYLLYRGAIYLKGFEPGFDYKQGSLVSKNVSLLKSAKANLVDSGLFDSEDLFFDFDRNRLLSHFSLVKNHADKIKSFGLVPVIVEEYPSSDFFCVDLEFV